MKMPKNSLSQDELNAFLEAVKDVKRLVHDKMEQPRPVTTKAPRQITQKKQAAFYFQESSFAEIVTQEESLSFQQASTPEKLLRKLKKGQYNVQAVLDLHGLTVSEAEVELSCFLTECLLRSKRVVLLVHGKGRDPQAPVLKNKLNQWLRHYDKVLAFCTALPRHGGQGALYLLLKAERGD